MATVAAGAGMDPITVSAAVTMAASCAFMLPVATPPNALVFATGHVTVAAMIRAGLVMNLLSVLPVSLAAQLLAPLLPGLRLQCVFRPRSTALRQINAGVPTGG